MMPPPSPRPLQCSIPKLSGTCMHLQLSERRSSRVYQVSRFLLVRADFLGFEPAASNANVGVRRIAHGPSIGPCMLGSGVRLKLIETLKPYLLREELRHTCPIDLETHEVKGLLAMRLLESSHLVKPCLDPSLAQASFVTVFDDWLPRRLLYLTESGSQSNIPIRLLVHLCVSMDAA